MQRGFHKSFSQQLVIDEVAQDWRKIGEYTATIGHRCRTIVILLTSSASAVVMNVILIIATVHMVTLSVVSENNDF